MAAEARSRGGGRSEPRRIVVNGRFLTQPVTGVQRYARELVRELDAALERDPAFREASTFELLTPPGAPRLPLPRIEQRPCGSGGGHLWEQRDLPRHAGRAPLLCLCNFSPLLARHALLVVHDVQPLRFPKAYSFAYRTWFRVVLPLMARRARKVVTVSEFSRGEIAACLGLAPAAIAVVPNAAGHITAVAPDGGILERLGLAPNSYFLALGSLAAHKNVRLLAGIADRLALPLVIAGESNARVLGAAATDGRAERAIFAGRVSDAEARSLYENAAAFLFPSRYEGFGIPPLEAMSLGCPVVSSDAASLPEVLGDAAIYCAPDDADAWVEAANALAADPGRRAGLAEAGLNRARGYRWRNSFERLRGTIETVF